MLSISGIRVGILCILSWRGVYQRLLIHICSTRNSKRASQFTWDLDMTLWQLVLKFCNWRRRFCWQAGLWRKHRINRSKYRDAATRRVPFLPLRSFSPVVLASTLEALEPLLGGTGTHLPDRVKLFLELINVRCQEELGEFEATRRLGVLKCASRYGVEFLCREDEWQRRDNRGWYRR